MATTAIQTMNGHSIKTQHDAAAERAVLGSVLIDPDAIYQVSGFLRPEHFYLVVNQIVYTAMLELSGRREPVDVLTLLDRVRPHQPGPRDGWESYLIGLLGEVPVSLHIHAYGKIVEEHAIRRQMTRAAERIAKLSIEDGDVDEQLGQAETLVFGIRQGRTIDGVHSPREYVSAALDSIHERMAGGGQSGLPTGFLDLDTLLGGLRAPFPYIIAARPGMGKSALCGNIAAHNALKQKKSVLFFAAEMTEQQMAYRIFAAETGVPLTRIQEGTLDNREHSLVLNAAGRLSESRLFIDASPGLTPGQVRARSMRYHAEHGLDLIVVDHLHRMNPDQSKASRNLELGEMTRSLVDTAKHINAPVLIAAQLSRAVEERANKRPDLSDLRESGAIEEEAYAVLFLYRDEYYNPTLTDKANICEVLVKKHRDGPVGVVDLFWSGHLTRFDNLQPQRHPLGEIKL